MNEARQIISFLITACDEKDRTINELSQRLNRQEAEPVKPLPPSTIANG